ncbi:hypothetical protein UT300003_32720 [Clostridium sardiniense]
MSLKRSLKIISISLIMMLILSLMSCTKTISVENKTVKGTVKEVHIDNGVMIPITSGKITTYTWTPDSYYSVISYNGGKVSIDSLEQYNYCKKRVGKEVNLNLRIVHKEDGTESRKITEVIMEE